MDSVVEYNKNWVKWFGEIRAALPEQFLVEHVGSTAVPGLAAKPIVDVDVVVRSESELAAAIAAITDCGWSHQGNLGVLDREAFTGRFDLPPHHLYVVIAGSQPHLDHIDLRDHLRAHPLDAARYGELKLGLAPLLAEDREAYLASKSELIAELLAAARAFTSQTTEESAEQRCTLVPHPRMLSGRSFTGRRRVRASGLTRPS